VSNNDRTTHVSDGLECVASGKKQMVVVFPGQRQAVSTTAAMFIPGRLFHSHLGGYFLAMFRPGLPLRLVDITAVIRSYTRLVCNEAA
jgi:hypothetical protein